jgi:uncharacterized protein
MYRKPVSALTLLVALAMGASAFAGADTPNCSPGSTTEATKCGPDPNSEAQFSPVPAVPAAKSANLLAATVVPRVVFQINQAADAPNILRYVANYLNAEPAAEVAVVGYAGGIDFMLKGARDAAGKPYADQLKALADRGVHFEACGNTLKTLKLAADAVVAQATVVPSAVNEIIRLQTREGYAYFRH